MNDVEKRCLENFQIQMLCKLQEGEVKHGSFAEYVDDYPMRHLLDKFDEEVAELKQALVEGNSAEIVREAADVANLAMFLAMKGQKKL